MSQSVCGAADYLWGLMLFAKDKGCRKNGFHFEQFVKHNGTKRFYTSNFKKGVYRDRAFEIASLKQHLTVCYLGERVWGIRDEYREHTRAYLEGGTNWRSRDLEAVVAHHTCAELQEELVHATEADLVVLRDHFWQKEWDAVMKNGEHGFLCGEIPDLSEGEDKEVLQKMVALREAKRKIDRGLSFVDEEHRLALAMALHRRLGAGCQLNKLPESIVSKIAWWNAK